MSNIKDMTVGSPAKLIITFAIPLMLGNVCQQFYTMVDTIVVGQVVGVEALAALGAADWLNWMVLGIITGFTQGFSILVSQRFGADDLKGMRKAIAMMIYLSAAIAIVTTLISHLAVKPMLSLLNTPENIFNDSLLYLRITFSGIIVIMTYNVLASILRALGDSKTPLVAMLIAASINVVLDIVFVGFLGFGVGGAAAATVISQGCSCLFCIKAIRNLPMIALNSDDWKISRTVSKQLILLGTPMAFQNAIIAVGGLVVQYVINGFGFIFVAGYTATNKLYGLLELAATSFGFSMATFTGQNLGANKPERIKEGMKAAIKMAIGTALVISVCMIIFGKQIVMLFVSKDAAEANSVLDIAYKYLFVMSTMLFVLYLLHLYRSALQGMGDTIIPMASGIIELIMRISVVLLLPRFVGEYGVYLAEVTAWIGAEILLMVTYYKKINKILKK